MKKTISVKVKPDLWDRFRKHCIDLGVSYSDKFEELLKEFLKK